LKAGINTGGKSGEFFFFSQDNKLIIKTISKGEMDALMDKLPKFLNYFKKNPQSQIAKIYGAFTFEKFVPHEKYRMILMRNVHGLPTANI